jgi:hypothetical protein
MELESDNSYETMFNQIAEEIIDIKLNYRRNLIQNRRYMLKSSMKEWSRNIGVAYFLVISFFSTFFAVYFLLALKRNDVCNYDKRLNSDD